MEYTVLVYKDEEGGFWAEVPASLVDSCEFRIMKLK